MSTDNPLRGEVQIKGESGREYTFRLGTNALAKMQQALGEKTIKGLLGRLSAELKDGDFDVVVLRQIVQAGIVGEFTEEQAGDVLDDCGLGATLTAVSESLNKTLGGGKNPRKGPAKKTS